MNMRPYHAVIIGLDPRGIDVARAAAARFERVAVVVPRWRNGRSPACNGAETGEGRRRDKATATALLLSAGQRACVARETIAALKRWSIARQATGVDGESRSQKSLLFEAARLVTTLATRRWSALLGELRSQGIDVYVGRPEFDDRHVLTVDGDDGPTPIVAENFTLAVGCRTGWPRWAGAELFGNGVWTGESLLEDLAEAAASEGRLRADRDRAAHEPVARLLSGRAAVVVGGGIRGLEQALLLRLLGLRVTVVDRDEERIVPVTREILARAAGEAITSDVASSAEPPRETERLARLTLKQLAQAAGVHFVCDDVLGAEAVQAAPHGRYAIRLVCRHGRTRWTDIVVHCGTQLGQTAGLRLDRIGLLTDENDRVWCDRRGQTWIEGIRAVGDVVGFRTTREWRVANVRRIDQSSATNAAHISAGKGAEKHISASVTG